MQNPIEILDCMPEMADVVSGAVSRPREPREGEDLLSWLNESGIIPRLRKYYGKRALVYSHRRDIKPPVSLGLGGFPYGFYLNAISPVEGEEAITIFLLVNDDATRCALVDPVKALIDTWRRLSQSPGRPPIEDPSPKTEAQRRWRERKKGI